MIISLIIPTYNRIEVLEKTLEALSQQRLDAGDFEVLVVDDGSTDETASRVRSMQRNFPVPLHYFYQPNRKQGAARNLGARNARGDLLIFLGDDTVPQPGFLIHHLRAHSRDMKTDDTDQGLRRIVIGYTTWPDEFKVTPFLHYIGEQGWQFGFSLIDDPENVPFNYFYTSNLSMRRQFFLESGGFDESFQEYGWEDIELSLRLQKLGMTLLFNSEAKAHHYHYTTLASFVERQRKVGYSAWIFYQKHPEMAEFLSVERADSYRWSDHLKMTALTWLCRLTEHNSFLDLSRFYPDLMSYHYLCGLHEAQKQGTFELGVNQPDGVR